MINLLVVEILQTTLNLHVLMLCVSEGIFDTELQRFSCDAQILNMVVVCIACWSRATRAIDCNTKLREE